ncbi:MAG: TonB-dependent receptor, partial [Pseudomonadota bacterium]
QLLGFQNLLDNTTSYSFPDELVENNFDDSTTGAELLGFYLQSVLRPIQGLTLSTGIRLDDYKATSVGFLDTNEIDAATDTEEFTWRLGLSYEIDSIATNLYASLATGFTPNLRAVTASGEFVEPETSKQAELGFKTDFADGDVLLTVAAYRLIQEDVAVEDPDNRAFSVNGGEVTSDGLEIELAGEPLPGMNFSFGVAFMDPETTSSNGVFGLMEGEQPRGTTSLNAGGLISYTIGDGRLKGLRVGGSIRHLGERETTSPLPDSDLEGFTVANVFFEYAFRGVDIGLFINNITDELYVESSNLPNNTYFGFERNVTLRVGASF